MRKEQHTSTTTPSEKTNVSIYDDMWYARMLHRFNPNIFTSRKRWIDMKRLRTGDTIEKGQPEVKGENQNIIFPDIWSRLWQTSTERFASCTWDIEHDSGDINSPWPQIYHQFVEYTSRSNSVNHGVLIRDIIMQRGRTVWEGHVCKPSPLPRPKSANKTINTATSTAVTPWNRGAKRALSKTT